VAIGQRADVRIELTRKEGVLRVPIEMVHHDASGPFFYADHDGKIAIVRPRLGITGATHVEIVEGLADGDEIFASEAGSSLPAGRRWRAP